MEAKLKHLEFIQGVITRMSSNSFLIKGWAITLVSGLFALAVKDTEPRFALISYFTIPCFWFLDAFFLCQERRYRLLYEDTCKRPQDQITFSMNAEIYSGSTQNTWIRAFFSRVLLAFYGTTMAVVFMVMCLIKR